MTTFAPISADAQATILVCAHLTPSQAGVNGPPPYSPAEWAKLASVIHGSLHKPPSFLLDESAESLRTGLGLSPAEAERLRRLLDRGAQLAAELERLASLGIWVLTKVDDDYPVRYRNLLRQNAPPVLFGAGDRALLRVSGLAVVGSRNVDEDTATFARAVAGRCVSASLVVVSGAAKGIDREAMRGALEADGQAIGVVADSLERMIRSLDVRGPIVEGQLLLLTPYHPRASFSVGAAMGRNKLIYTLAQFGLVVTSSLGEGGTWAGAQEVLHHRWVPLFVRDGEAAGAGNRALLESGALSFPGSVDEIPHDLIGWFEDRSATRDREGTRPLVTAGQASHILQEPPAPPAEPESVQLSLFGGEPQ